MFLSRGEACKMIVLLALKFCQVFAGETFREMLLVICLREMWGEEGRKGGREEAWRGEGVLDA